MKNKRSFFVRVLFACLVTLFCAIICSYTYLAYMSSILNKNTKDRLLEVSNQTKTSLNEKFESGITELEKLSYAISHKSGYDIEEMKNILYNYSHNSNFTKVIVIEPNGEGFTKEFKEVNFSDKEYFQKAIKGEENISEFFFDEASGELESTFAVPIFDDKNNIIGVLAASKPISKFRNLLNISIFNGEGYLLLVNSSGSIIASQNEKSFNYNIKNINEVNFEGNKTFTESLSKSDTGVLKTKVRGANSQYLAYVPVGINDWYVLSVVPSNILEETINSLNIISVIMWIIISVILLIIVYYILYSRKKSENELERIAFVDPITNELNYNAFELEFNNKMNNDDNRHYALVSLDIDKFKIFNDIFGFNNGNILLKNIAFWISRKLSNNEIYARSNSDNFLILLEEESEEEVLNRMRDIIKDVSYNTNEVIKNINYRNSSYKLILTYGICKIKNRNYSLDTFVDRANIAKDTVKGSHKTNGAFYTKELSDKILMDKELESYMDKALKEKQFKVYFQPKVSFADGSIIGAEALVRWYHPEKGIIFPNEFIPLFEKNQFIKELDYYMFNEVSHYIQKWQEAGISLSETISINLSRVHISDMDLADKLLEIVKKYNVDPSKVGVELTESAFFEDEELLINMMDKLRSVGFKTYIDDFGSGYSALNTLKNLKVDYLKFDKGFLSNLENSEKGQLILYNLVNMAKDIGICTVAEGVETLLQANFLKEKGFDIAQGYYYYKPMPAMEMMSKLMDGDKY